MALSDYLSDAPDDLQPDETEEEQRLRLLNAGPPGGKSAWWKPPSDIPAPRPIEDSVGETPAPEPMETPGSAQAIPGVIDPMIPNSIRAALAKNPADTNVQEANARLQRVFGNKPKPVEPKWYQRLGAAAAGAAAGYSNAAGRSRPIDASGAADVILGGPGNRKREAAWQHDVQGAQLAAQQAGTERDVWYKRDQELARQRLEQSQEGRLDAQAKREAGRNDIDLQKIKQADAEKQDALALKGREDAFLLEQGQKAPAGWDTIPSRANPGRSFAAPPRFDRLSPELVPYASGRKAGEVVPYGEIKAARALAGKDTLAQNKPMRPEDSERVLLDPSNYSPEVVAKAQELYDKKHRPPDASGRTDTRNDRSYQFNVGELGKVAKPVEDALPRMSRLQETLAQNTPQADALVAPELLTVMAGGAGSGLRMNEAEIARIVGGRTNWEGIKARLGAWQANPTKGFAITPEQRRQIGQLVNAVNEKLLRKQSIVTEAHRALIETEDPLAHRQIVTSAREKLSQIDQGGGVTAPPAAKEVHNQAEYDLLPVGAKYTQNGVEFTKKAKK